MTRGAGSYNDWKQVAGYFDGDGCADFDAGKWVLHPKLSFSDNYQPHILMIRDFLRARDIVVWGLFHDVGGAWKVGVGQARSVRKMAVRMCPYLFKKRAEVKAILDYLDDRISGTQLVNVFNESVRSGNRTGRIRRLNIPHTRGEGQRLRRIESANQARMMGVRNQILPDNVLEQIRRDLTTGVATNSELARKWGANPSTISRAVFGRSERG